MSVRSFISSVVVCAVLFVSARASAQVSPVPNRDKTWETVTGITMVAGGATELLMPRIFYSDPEVTVGWKTRFHVSVLAPVMTLTALTALNEFALKNAFQSPRPGCDSTNFGLSHCDTYGMMSTHSFAAGSALGHGMAVFFVDTFKWSGSRVNVGSLAGNIVAPLLLGTMTAVGRGVGNWETGGQIAVGSVAGLAFGALSGVAYAMLQRPECGYTGDVICW